jgi:hypothetical protein
MISLLVPTRNRPEAMERLCQSAYSTAKEKDDIEIVFYVDKDDKESKAKAEELKSKDEYNIKFLTGKRIVLSNMWNECYKIATGPIYQHAGDDIVHRTRYWDNYIRKEFEKYPDKILFVYGRDGIVDSDELGTHGFIHKNWIETVGYFVPPYFSADYNDTWLTDLAKRINRLVYLPDLYIEHLHFSVGKAELDETYKDQRARRKRDKVRALYREKEKEREQDALKLQKFIKHYSV